MTKELPGHIAEALARAGGSSDTAGQPWLGRDLQGQHHRFDHDDGQAAEAFQQSLISLAAGSGNEADVVASLAQARLFVPIIAEATVTSAVAPAVDAASKGSALPEGHPSDDAQHLHGDKESEMALVTVKAPDGRIALPVFSSTEQLTRWHPQARPVAVYAPRAALSAVSEKAQLMVVDPGSPLSFVVRRPALWALAQQRTWLPSYMDDRLKTEVQLIVERVVGDSSAEGGFLVKLEVLPGAGIQSLQSNGVLVNGGGVGPELRLVLHLRAGLRQEELQTKIQLLQEQLSRNELFAEGVDSLQISIQDAASR